MFFPSLASVARMRLGALPSTLQTAVRLLPPSYAPGARAFTTTTRIAFLTKTAVDPEAKPRKKAPAKKSAKKVTTAEATKEKTVKAKKPKPKPQEKLKPKKAVKAKKPEPFVVTKDMMPPSRTSARAISLYFQEKYLREGKPSSRTEAQDMMRAGAAEFNQLPESEKLTYSAAAAKLGEERRAAYDEWAKRPDAAKILRTLNARRRKRGQLRLYIPVALRKKTPPNAYTLFVKDFCSGGSQLGRSSVFSAAGAQWKTLPADEKQKYTDRAVLEKERLMKEHLVDNAHAA
ncbi:hypothetical protein BD626DRAFT_437602 [Schizophyllum amplum]|uniref:HMG box domain-containing protein n=1 Tax=Schizophyllum amplum TaxID=97359 RepID=A0A550C2T2_9AGAR|nr:hypothetical protein BD626DRAFT_437602 [Auriculariopsis ampla]